MRDFFENVQRYPRYLISFSLGVLYTFVEPLIPLLKKPTTAIALISFLIGAFLFVTFTLRAMLGLNMAWILNAKLESAPLGILGIAKHSPKRHL